MAEQEYKTSLYAQFLNEVAEKHKGESHVSILFHQNNQAYIEWLENKTLQYEKRLGI